MRVLITGGTGYIGYSLVNELSQLSEIEEVIIYDNLYKKNQAFFTEGTRLNNVKFIKGDILDTITLKKTLKGIDCLVHLAAHVDFPYNYHDNFKYEQVNHYGTANLYAALKENSPKKIIYLSSAAIYGFHHNIDENTEPVPDNFYGKSKLQGEKYLQLLSDQSEVYIFRSANVFGYNPVMRFDSVINNFFLESKLQKRINILGSGNQLRPFIFIKELVKFMSKVICHQSTRPGIYNLVQGNLSINSLRDFILQQNENVEFTYTTSSQDLASVNIESIHQYGFPTIEESLAEAYKEFASAFRF